jgi:hypothetical protein
VEAGERHRPEPRSEESEHRDHRRQDIGMAVTDQDRAVDFYAGTLGLDKRLDTPVE